MGADWFYSIKHRRLNPQDFVQLRARRCVLQKDFFIRKNNGHGAKSGQCTFMETTQNELLLARVNVDIADSKNTGLAGGKLFGIDLELFTFDVQPPLGDGAKFW